ncbi:MAG TPA: hypothetical protein VGI07_03535 [Solirubrobacteraceae bacterium]
MQHAPGLEADGAPARVPVPFSPAPPSLPPLLLREIPEVHPGDND